MFPAISAHVYLSVQDFYFIQTRLLPKTNERKKRITKIKKSVFAMEAALAAIPKNPKMPAMIAITRKITDQRNIIENFNGE